MCENNSKSIKYKSFCSTYLSIWRAENMNSPSAYYVVALRLKYIYI